MTRNGFFNLCTISFGCFNLEYSGYSQLGEIPKHCVFSLNFFYDSLFGNPIIWTWKILASAFHLTFPHSFKDVIICSIFWEDSWSRFSKFKAIFNSVKFIFLHIYPLYINAYCYLNILAYGWSHLACPGHYIGLHF